MEKSKTHYWAIFEDKQSVFEGSFSECWKQFVAKYGSETIANLESKRVRIARKA